MGTEVLQFLLPFHPLRSFFQPHFPPPLPVRVFWRRENRLSSGEQRAAAQLAERERSLNHFLPQRSCAADLGSLLPRCPHVFVERVGVSGTEEGSKGLVLLVPRTRQPESRPLH